MLGSNPPIHVNRKMLIDTVKLQGGPPAGPWHFKAPRTWANLRSVESALTTSDWFLLEFRHVPSVLTCSSEAWCEKSPFFCSPWFVWQCDHFSLSKTDPPGRTKWPVHHLQFVQQVHQFLPRHLFHPQRQEQSDKVNPGVKWLYYVAGGVISLLVSSCWLFALFLGLKQEITSCSQLLISAENVDVQHHNVKDIGEYSQCQVPVASDPPRLLCDVCSDFDNFWMLYIIV